MLGLLLLLAAPLVPGFAQGQPVARVGIDVPVMGITFRQAGHDWQWSVDSYFSRDDMNEIKNALHADYVRTGFVPDWVRVERPRWRHEDLVMDNACAAGLDVLVIVPTGYDRLGIDDLRTVVRTFFARYVAREPECGLLAEIGNEENLTTKPADYTTVFEALAPTIAAAGVPVVTAGTSGLDTRWTRDVSSAVAAWCPAALQSGGMCTVPAAYALHPYGIGPKAMRSAIEATAAAAHVAQSRIDITEYGAADAATLSDAIFALDAQPLETIYEYRCQPTDDSCKYGLKDNPGLYEAVAAGFAYMQTHRAARQTPPFSAARR